MQSWITLYVAILLEVVGTLALKFSRGMTQPIPTAVSLAAYGLSLGALSIALKQIEVGIAYAIWSGLGTTAVALIGILYFREPATLMKLASLLLVALGVIGLNLAGARH